MALYWISELFVRYLGERWGWKKSRSLFLISGHQDSDIRDHFSMIYGQKLSAVEADWRQDLLSQMR